MRIQRIETFADATLCFVRVTTDDGAEGWGQTAPYHADLTAAAVHKHVTPLALGADASDIDGLITAIEHQQYKFFGTYLMRALCGLDSALWDLHGKAAGKPVCELLGGKPGPILAYGSSMRRDNTAAEEVDRLKRLRDERGFNAFKVRFGHRFGGQPVGPADRTEHLLPLVAETFAGEGVYLIADANGAYESDEAIAVGRRMAEVGYQQFEEPCHFQDLDGTRRVNEAIPIPVSGGEQDYDPRHWRTLIETGVVDIIQPDLGYCGGLARTLRICRHAATQGLRVMPHSANLSFMTLMAMHLMAALDNAGPFLEFTIEDNAWIRGVFEPALTVEDGRAIMPAGPGWGVTLNPDWLAAATRQVSEP